MPILNTHGARVSYSRTGTGDAVLLIQGVGAIGNAWRPQVEALSQRFSVITFDNRGIGASPITDGGMLTIEGMAEDALAVLNVEGINRCHVVGHSMGGLIAAQLALMWPRRVKSLALLCTFPDGKSGSRLTPDTFLTGVRTRIGTRRMRRKAFLSLVLSKAGMEDSNRPALEATMTELFARDLADQPPIIMRQLKAMARYDAMWRLWCLRSIRTLVMSGAQDRIAKPEYGRALAAAIPGARYVEIPDAAHAVPIESPEVVNRLLTEHLMEVTRRVAS
jgi:pimeloyl-ACP methyl ester carboxylesterase